jgi:hypothetical protein
MIVRSFILILGFCLLTPVAHAEPIKENDPSETYLCREPGLWGEHSLTSDAIAEKTSMLLHKLFLQNPAWGRALSFTQIFDGLAPLQTLPSDNKIQATSWGYGPSRV